MNNVECPYCGEENEVSHDNGENYSEDETTETECSGCEKIFQIETSVIFDHRAIATPCLNDGNHHFEQVYGCPKEVFVGVTMCRICGERKTDTAKNQESMKEYIKSLNKKDD